MNVANNQENIQPKTREQYKKVRESSELKEQKPQKKEKTRIRLIPIWLRLIIVIVLVALSAMIGVIVGYGVIGDGDPKDALKKSTWQHIVDLVEKE
jgi:flagellar basal body-associated protein FliL